MTQTNTIPDISAKPWTKSSPPRRVLAIRLQAMGDLVITLPYLQALRMALPGPVEIDLLTRREVDPIPRNIQLFNHVYSIGGGRNFKKILLHTFLLLPKLLSRRYDMIIDLQNNTVSRVVRRVLRPKAWSAFDRFSPIAAGERTRLTIEAAGFAGIRMNTRFRLKEENRGCTILKNSGWNGTDMLVVLNPAGFVETRNWAMQNYVEFARRWLKQFPDTKFLVLGIPLIAQKAALLEQELGDRLLNLVDRTNPLEAFAVLQHTSLVLSEDSGLMHMAWVSGIPTLVLFGSTRSDWSKPLGSHSFFLDSSDLPCGHCMQSVCRFGDTRCLSRYTPQQVLQHALTLIQNKNRQPFIN